MTTTVTVNWPEPPPAVVTIQVSESVARWIADKLYLATLDELGLDALDAVHPYYAFEAVGLNRGH